MKSELEEKNKESEIYKLLEQLQNEDKYEIIKQLLSTDENNYMVTPKEIDQIVANMSDVISAGINTALN